MHRFAKVSALVLLVIIAALLCVPAVATAATGTATKTPVSSFAAQLVSILTLVSVAANIVQAVSQGKIKAAAQSLANTTQHVQSQLAGVDPAIYTICDQFFNGPDGRQLGAQQGLALLAKQHPEWSLGASQVAALVDHFAPILAKIKV